MSAIIQVKDLSKSFIISHEGQERYTALRDVVTNKAKKLFSLSKPTNSLKKSGSAKEEFWALKDVSFEIEKGDRVGIIGRNGAGKSTLLKILSRITEPTSGEIRIKGRVASLLEVGTGFHPELTGRENIFLNGAILGMSRAEIRKKFDEIVAFAEVEKFLDTPVKRYSSGMYVRLAFAVAAHLEPEILVVDEVLAVGDAQFQKKCLGKMEDVSKNEGRTVLFVSHNMAAIKALCKSVIFLKSGEVNSVGEVNNILNQYLKTEPTEEKTNQWVNTSVKLIDILQIKITNEIDNAILNIDEILRVETEIIIKEKKEGLALEIFFYNNEDILLFNCITPIEINLRHAKIINKIPASIFNTGEYKITAGISHIFSSWIIKHDGIVFFELHEMLARDISYLGKWEGLIKPSIQTEIIISP